MKPKITLRKALNDPELLGSALGGDSWANWRAMLLAANGEPLEPAELSAFREFTGRTEPPQTRVDELWCAIGRRGGKSRAMAALAAYYLCDHSDTLVRGEKGLLLLVAQDKRAAKISLDYIQGCFEATPLLNQLVKERQRDELRLTNGIVIESAHPLYAAFVGLLVSLLYVTRSPFGVAMSQSIPIRKSSTPFVLHVQQPTAR